jgi:hypothetical protein
MPKKRQQRDPLPKLLIVCEGEVTEPTYFHGVRRTRRVPKERLVIHEAAGAPWTIVTTAIDLKAENDHMNDRDGITVEDHVWAVFDCDRHPRLAEAMALATSNGVHVGFSNPSFELFLLYHYQSLERSEERNRVSSLLKRHIPTYNKAFDYDAEGMATRYPEARTRCAVVNGRSELVAGVPRSPYCSVFELIDYLKRY